MTSQTGKPDISRSKNNQAMKFGQQIEYNMINIFHEKLCTNCGGETNFSSFFKKSKLSMSLDQQSEVSDSLFLLYVQVEDYQNILKPKCWPLAFTSYKVFFTIKKRSGTSLPASFSAGFLKKNIHILLTDQISLSGCFYFLRYLTICLL